MSKTFILMNRTRRESELIDENGENISVIIQGRGWSLNDEIYITHCDTKLSMESSDRE